MAAQYGIDVLGSLPLDIRIREDADGGRPTVVADPHGALAQAYLAIARKVAVKVAASARDLSGKIPAIKVSST